MVLQPHLGKQKVKIASFHLNAECCFANRYTTHIHIITWSQLNHPSFAKKSTVCTKQNLGREYSMLPFVTAHSSFPSLLFIMLVAVSEVGVVLSGA